MPNGKVKAARLKLAHSGADREAFTGRSGFSNRNEAVRGTLESRKHLSDVSICDFPERQVAGDGVTCPMGDNPTLRAEIQRTEVHIWVYIKNLPALRDSGPPISSESERRGPALKARNLGGFLLPSLASIDPVDWMLMPGIYRAAARGSITYWLLPDAPIVVQAWATSAIMIPAQTGCISEYLVYCFRSDGATSTKNCRTGSAAANATRWTIVWGLGSSSRGCHCDAGVSTLR